MINEHLQEVRRIMELVPRDWWPSAFSGLVAAECHEKMALASYLRSILQAQVQGCDGLNSRFDLTEESLIPNVDLPPLCDGTLPSLAFLPSGCHFNGVAPIFDPVEALNVLGLTGNEQEIQMAVHAIDQYAADMLVPLRCAAHPYTDCVLLTALLFVLKERVRDGKMLNFVAADWADLPETLSGQSPFDFTYTSSSWVQWPNADYAFRNIKSASSKGRILFNAAAYDRAESRRKSGRRSPRPQLSGVNFNGDFDPKAESYTLYFKDEQGAKVAVQLSGMRSDFDYEAKMIVALANGTLNLDAIVPSLQGYLWAVECGFLRSKDGKCGTLVFRDEAVEASKGNVGYGVKLQPSSGDKSKRRADFVLTALFDLQDLAIECIRERLDEDGDLFAPRIMGILKGPIIFTRQYDSGILSRIPAELALKAAFPGAQLFENEFNYTPPWWSALNDEAVNAGRTATKDKTKGDKIGGLKRE